MIGSVSANFSDVVLIGERVENGLRSGRLAQNIAGGGNTRKPPFNLKKREGEAHHVAFDRNKQPTPNFLPTYQPPVNQYPYVAATTQTPYQQAHTPSMTFRPPSPFPATIPPQQTPFNPPQNNQSWNSNPNTSQNTHPSPRKPNTQDRKPPHFDPIPMTYTELLPHLIRNSLVVPCPLKPVEPPYPRGYDQNAKCDYHAGAVGHSTENCQALKFKVQQLINAKWLNFKKDAPNVGDNPLPSHGGPSVSVIDNGVKGTLKSKVAEIKTPMKIIFRELVKSGMIHGDLNEENTCSHHPGEGHDLQNCEEFRSTLQALMDSQLVQIGCLKEGSEVSAIDEPLPGCPKPLTIFYIEEPEMPVPPGVKPITIQVPTAFPYKNDKAVPWKYEVEIHTHGGEGSSSKAANMGNSSIENIVGVGGMTRSGRIYSPVESQKEQPRERVKEHLIREKEKEEIFVEKQAKKQAENQEENQEEKKRVVTEEEACEFLKLIKQSEYRVIDQLNRMPARISLLSLMMNSEAHRKALLKILNEAHVVHNLSLEKFEGIVGNISANNFLTFTDDEIPSEGMGHNKALHISVKCKDHILARVLIDNGSSLNVMPKSTLAKLPADGSHMRPSSMIVRAFDGSRREVIGEIDLPIQVGPVTFEVSFQVMDILPAYSCLLGRPWIHCAGAVPSTLHQKLKFIVDDKLIIVSAEEDLLVSKPVTTPYIEAAEEALETSFQALEIANATFVKEGEDVIKRQPSDASLMIAKVMMEGSYQPGGKLGKNERGLTSFLELVENKNRYGLGYIPSKEDRKRIQAEKREKRQARLENRSPNDRRVPLCHISESFRSTGFELPEVMAVMGEEGSMEGDRDELVRACPPEVELGNWETIELPVTFVVDPK